MTLSRKLIALSIGLALLLSGTVFSTIAYFTDRDSITNIFTVGSVRITLDEARVTPDGEYARMLSDGTLEEVDAADEADRIADGNIYHLIPAKSYPKDPTMAVVKGSEIAYVCMCIPVNEVQSMNSAFAPVQSFVCSPLNRFTRMRIV